MSKGKTIYKITHSYVWPAMTFRGLWKWNVITRKTSPMCDVAKASTCHIVNYICYYPSQQTCIHTRMLIIYSRYTVYRYLYAIYKLLGSTFIHLFPIKFNKANRRQRAVKSPITFWFYLIIFTIEIASLLNKIFT